MGIHGIHPRGPPPPPRVGGRPGGAAGGRGRRERPAPGAGKRCAPADEKPCAATVLSRLPQAARTPGSPGLAIFPAVEGDPAGGEGADTAPDVTGQVRLDVDVDPSGRLTSATPVTGKK